MTKKYIFIIAGVVILLLVLAGVFFVSQKTSNNAEKLTPIILSISPTGLPQNSVGITLRVYGKNFTETSVINWHGTPVTTDTQNAALGYITTNVPASNFTNYGEFPITVTNGKGATSNAINFTVARTLQDLLDGSKNGTPNNSNI